MREKYSTLQQVVDNMPKSFNDGENRAEINEWWLSSNDLVKHANFELYRILDSTISLMAKPRRELKVIDPRDELRWQAHYQSMELCYSQLQLQVAGLLTEGLT